jgi:Heavy-metal resistance protein CzcE
VLILLIERQTVSMNPISLRLVSLLGATAVASGCASTAVSPAFYGQPAAASAAQRTIVINPDTQHVNVEGGQVVRFIVGDKAFAWHFLTAAGIRSFRLNDVVPAGTLDHVVTAYVSPDPRYIGGRERKK